MSHQPNGVGTISWPSGYTEGQQVDIKNSAGTVIGRAGWAWKRADGTEDGLSQTITRSGDSGTDSSFQAHCHKIPGCKTTGDPFDTPPTPVNPNATATVDWPSCTTTSAEVCLVLYRLLGGANASVGTPASWTVFESRGGTTGTDGACDIDYRQVTSTGTYDPANGTHTLDADCAHAQFQVPFAAAGAAVDPFEPVRVHGARARAVAATHYRLSPPLQAAPQPPVETTVRTHTARPAQTYHGPAHRSLSRLGAPVVVQPPVSVTPPVEPARAHTVTRPRGAGGSHYTLRPPTVVSAAAPAFVAEPLRTVAAASRRPQASSRLNPPTVVAAGAPAETVVRTHAARFVSHARGALSRLAPPAVVDAEVVALYVDRVTVSLAAQTHAPRRTISTLGAPGFVQPAVSGEPLDTKLTTSLGLGKQPPRGFGRFRRAGYSLGGPAAIELFVARAPQQHLARWRRPLVDIRLGARAPQVAAAVAAAYADRISVKLARSLPARPTTARLAAPQVVGRVFVEDKLAAHLTRATAPAARPTTAKLAPPQVVGRVFVEDRLAVRLTRAPAARSTSSKLAPPQVVAAAPLETVVRAHLTRPSYRPATTVRLTPPTVVTGEAFEAKLRAHLAESTRTGRATGYGVAAPAIVDPQTEFPPVETTVRAHLTRARTRPAHTARLAAPAVVFPPFFETRVKVGLTRALPPRSVTSRLAAAQVVGRVFVEDRIAVRLTRPSYRPSVTGRVVAPAVVGPPAGSPLETVVRTHATKALPPRSHSSRLAPPAVVDPAVFQSRLAAHLTRAARPKPSNRLGARPPQVVTAADAPDQEQQTLRTWLVRSAPRPGRTFELRAPAVVDPALEPQAIRAHLARQYPRLKFTTFLGLPTVLAPPDEQLRISTHLTRRPPRPLEIKTVLGRPTVIAPPPEQLRLRTNLSRRPKRPSEYSSLLRRELIVGPPIPPPETEKGDVLLSDSRTYGAFLSDSGVGGIAVLDRPVYDMELSDEEVGGMDVSDALTYDIDLEDS